MIEPVLEAKTVGASRPERVLHAVNFLSNSKTQRAPLSQQLFFLEEKGLTAGEIHEALRKVSEHRGRSAPSAPLNGAPSIALVAGVAGVAAAAGFGFCGLLPEGANADETEQRGGWGRAGHQEEASASSTGGFAPESPALPAPRPSAHTTAWGSEQGTHSNNIHEKREWDLWCNLFSRLGRGRRDGKLPCVEVFELLRHQLELQAQLYIAVGGSKPSTPPVANSDGGAVGGWEESNTASIIELEDALEGLLGNVCTLTSSGEALKVGASLISSSAELPGQCDECVDMDFGLFSRALRAARNEGERDRKARSLLADDASWLNKQQTISSDTNRAIPTVSNHSESPEVSKSSPCSVLTKRLEALTRRRGLMAEDRLSILLTVLAEGQATAERREVGALTNPVSLAHTGTLEKELASSRTEVESLRMELAAVRNRIAALGKRVGALDDREEPEQAAETATRQAQEQSQAEEERRSSPAVVLKALENDNDAATLQKGLPILLMYCSNLVKQPENPRMRRIIMTNRTFVENVKPLKGALELLDVVGFGSAPCGSLEYKQPATSGESRSTNKDQGGFGAGDDPRETRASESNDDHVDEGDGGGAMATTAVATATATTATSTSSCENVEHAALDFVQNGKLLEIIDGLKSIEGRLSKAPTTNEMPYLENKASHTGEGISA